MINLLPDETKQQLRAAHTNIALVRYLLFLGIAVGFLVVAFAASYLFLANNKESIKKLEGNSQSTLSLYSAAQNKLSTIRTNIATAKSIMDQQISYSDIITGIAAALPSGIVIDKLMIDNRTISKPITISALGRSAESVPQIKDNFAKSLLFSNYNLISVETNAGDTSGFPVQISISITINKGITI